MAVPKSLPREYLNYFLYIKMISCFELADIQVISKYVSSVIYTSNVSMRGHLENKELIKLKLKSVRPLLYKDKSTHMIVLLSKKKVEMREYLWTTGEKNAELTQLI